MGTSTASIPETMRSGLYFGHDDIRVVERVKFVMKEGVVFKNDKP